MQPDVVLVAELIVEVYRWSKIGDIADGVHVDAAVVLDEIGVLGLHEDTDVIVVLLLPVAQGETDVMRVVLVLRVAAKVAVEITVHRVIDRREPCVPLAVFGIYAAEDIVGHVTEIIRLAVAFVLVVAQLVVGLKMPSLP